MAKHKQDLLDRIVSGISVRGFLLHPATLFGLATSGLIGGAIFLWDGHQEKIVNQDEYRLTAEKIQLTPAPKWVDDDLKQMVLGGSESPASILDTDLVPRTASVFQKAGYVERIHSIQKSRSGLEIDLVYRKPVALVELSEVTLRTKWPKANYGKKVLLPVDRQGVLMPEAVGKNLSLPLITVLYPAQFTKLKTWSEWPDQRIADAAAISGLFEQPLTSIGINYVMTLQVDPQGSESENSRPFVLYSGKGTRIIWGNAPGKESILEASPADKIMAIHAILTEHGSLDKFNLGQIDIRSGKAVSGGNSKTAANDEDLLSELK